MNIKEVIAVTEEWQYNVEFRIIEGWTFQIYAIESDVVFLQATQETEAETGAMPLIEVPYKVALQWSRQTKINRLSSL